MTNLLRNLRACVATAPGAVTVEFTGNFWSNIGPHCTDSCENSTASVSVQKLRAYLRTQIRTKQRTQQSNGKKLVNNWAIHGDPIC